MLRRIIVLTALSVGSLYGVAQAVSLSGGNEVVGLRNWSRLIQGRSRPDLPTSAIRVFKRWLPAPAGDLRRIVWDGHFSQ